MPNGENKVVKYVAPEDLFVKLQSIENKTTEDLMHEEKWLVNALYRDLKITTQQAIDFKGHIHSLKNGLAAAVPLICSKRCPFQNVCRAKFAGIEPLSNKPCMVELNLIQYYRRLYLDTFNVERDDFGSFVLVNELAEIEMYDFRATLVLALGDVATGDADSERPNIAQALLSNVPHYDEMGNVTHITQEIHAAFKLKETLKNRKLKILELLVATRKEMYKKDAALGSKVTDNFAEQQKKIMQRIEAMTNEIEAKKIDTTYHETIISEMPIT